MTLLLMCVVSFIVGWYVPWRWLLVGWALVAIILLIAGDASGNTVSAYQSNGELTLVLNTCAEVTHVQVLTEPVGVFTLQKDGSYRGDTPATTGWVFYVTCEPNGGCTPHDVFFTAKVIPPTEPELADVNSKLWNLSLRCLGIAIVLAAMLCVLNRNCYVYDEDQNG